MCEIQHHVLHPVWPRFSWTPFRRFHADLCQNFRSRKHRRHNLIHGLLLNVPSFIILIWQKYYVHNLPWQRRKHTSESHKKNHNDGQYRRGLTPWWWRLHGRCVNTTVWEVEEAWGKHVHVFLLTFCYLVGSKIGTDDSSSICGWRHWE